MDYRPIKKTTGDRELTTPFSRHRMEVDFTQRWRRRKALLLQRQVFFNPSRHEIEKIPTKSAEWIIKHHCLGSFPSATICYGIFRHGELSGVSVNGNARHKNTIPNVFGESHIKDCLVLQRFALLDALEFNAESYFLARVHTLLKRERYCGILTLKAMKLQKPIFWETLLFPVTSARSSKAITPSISDAPTNQSNTFFLTAAFCQIAVSANWSITKAAGIIWRESLKVTARANIHQRQASGVNGAFTGVTDSRADNKTTGKLRYAWSLHPKVTYLKVFLTSASGLMNCNENFFNEGNHRLNPKLLTFAYLLTENLILLC